MEGGIGYWAKVQRYVPPPEGAELNVGLEGDDVFCERTYKHIHYPMCEAGGAVVLRDKEADDGKDLVLDYPAIERGLQVMAEKYPRHFADFVQENGDATTGDVFVQCALLGDIVYG